MTPSIWDLLPSHLRSRDEESGGLLRALVAVLEEGADAVEADIDALADDMFIETCAEWIVPYIGDLVGVKNLHPLAGPAAFSNRARVADTIAFRRRKGTAAMLEELARTTTGWTARAVEFFETLVTTQHLDHVRHQAPATAPVRDQDAMELVGSPFDRSCHTIDVRPLDVHDGWFNIMNVGLFVWPLTSYPLDRATAAAVADPADGRYLVDPLGVDHAMAGPTVAETDIEHRADEEHVPGLLRRLPLHDELEMLRANPGARRRWFRPDDPAFRVWIQPTPAAPLAAIPTDDLSVCDLTDWDLPTGARVRVDPKLGRVAVSAVRPVHRLAVSWSFAFTADIGAGPWSRHDRAQPIAPVDVEIGVSATEPPGTATIVGTIGEAVDAWNAAQAANPVARGRIVLMDSHRYQEDLTLAGRIEVAAGSRLEILAARWPAPPGGPRTTDGLDPSGVRPCLIGDLEVIGSGDTDPLGELVVEGLLIGGRVTVVSPVGTGDGLGSISLRNCTLAPAAGGLRVEPGNDRCAVDLDRTITGSVRLAGTAGPLTVSDGIVHRPAGGVAIDGPGSDATLDGVTVLGAATLRTLSADDCVFDDTVTVARLQAGCLRFSYVPPGSVVPRRYRCQPELAESENPSDPTVADRLVPSFHSDDLENPGYGRLSQHVAAELLTGAESGAEMGAFRSALAPQRVANLLAALDEYLPLGRVAAPLPVLPQGDQP